MEKVIKIGRYIVETMNTIKQTANEFKVSPSTVSRYIHKLLPELNPELSNQVKAIINYHSAIRHLRGGEANKIKIRKEQSNERLTRNS